MLRTVFMGSPEFALASLEATRERTELLLVVTQPDRPAGRGRKLRPPPVKERAIELGVEVAQPRASVTRELGGRLAELAPDLVVVSAFGKFLGRRVLQTPRLGCINVHASLLPRYRGASPPVWAIRNGDEETGVTIQQMVLEMDAGDVLTQQPTPIEPDETAGELTDRLAIIGGDLLRSLFEGLEAGTVRPKPQDHSLATLAPPLSKDDGAIEWQRPARRIHDHVRAMSPWPVAFTTCDRGRLRVHHTAVVDERELHGEPGTVLRADPGAIHVACGEGVLDLVEAQCEGKRVMEGKELVCGRLLQPCERLGS